MLNWEMSESRPSILPETNEIFCFLLVWMTVASEKLASAHRASTFWDFENLNHLLLLSFDRVCYLRLLLFTANATFKWISKALEMKPRNRLTSRSESELVSGSVVSHGFTKD